MPLRSAVSSLGKTAEPGEMPAAPAPRLARRPGAYRSPPGAVDILSPDNDEGAEDTAPAPVPTEAIATSPPPVASKARVARKPRAQRVATRPESTEPSDVQATRSLIGHVEDDMLDLKAQMQKTLAKFQPRLERLQARHAELSASLVKQLTQ